MRGLGKRSAAVNSDTILARSKDLSPTIVGGRCVVLSIDAGAYFDFNQAASEIWHLLGEPLRLGKIAEILSRRYEVDVATIERDIIPFLQILIEKRLVSILEPRAGL